MSLRERADAIEDGRLRWVQGTPGPKGTCCLAWDGRDVEGDPGWAFNDAEADAVFSALDSGLLDYRDAFIDFNDLPGRTQAEVVALLRKASRTLTPTETPGES